MKVKMEFEVKDCTNCPFAKENRGHGECWTYCSHPKHGQKPYEDILWGCQSYFKAIPKWCPLVKGEK